MNDWLGLAFLILLVVGALIGIKVLANPKKRTAEDFEKGAADNPTFTGALLNALHDVTDPGAARAKEVRMQMKDGTFRKKKREGKANDSNGEEEE
jgi:hypothetical protein